MCKCEKNGKQYEIPRKSCFLARELLSWGTVCHFRLGSKHMTNHRNFFLLYLTFCGLVSYLYLPVTAYLKISRIVHVNIVFPFREPRRNSFFELVIRIFFLTGITFVVFVFQITLFHYLLEHPPFSFLLFGCVKTTVFVVKDR